MRRFISFGAGVQTTALAILTARGKVEDPAELMVFADTGDEKPETYAYLRDVFRPWAEANGLPLVMVNRGGETLYEYAWRYRLVPSVTIRWCTDKFKVTPIHRYLRASGATAKAPIETQIGISADEAHRAKNNRPVRYAATRYPLVEMGLRRADCRSIIIAEGLPEPPKSGCWYCPYQSLNGWRTIAAKHPALLDRALALEDRARARRETNYLGAHKPLRAIVGDGRQQGWDELLGNDAGCTSGACFV